MKLYEASSSQLHLDMSRLRELGLSLQQVAAFLETQPFVFAAYTEDEVSRVASLDGDGCSALVEVSRRRPGPFVVEAEAGCQSSVVQVGSKSEVIAKTASQPAPVD